MFESVIYIFSISGEDSSSFKTNQKVICIKDATVYYKDATEFTLATCSKVFTVIAYVQVLTQVV